MPDEQEMELSALRATYSVAGNPQLRMFTEFGLVAASRLWGFVLTRLPQCFDTPIETRYLAFLRQMIVSVRQYRPAMPSPSPRPAEVTPNCFIVRDANGQQIACFHLQLSPLDT